MPQPDERIVIDPEAEVAYVTAGEGPVARTVTVTDDLIVDLDEHGGVVGVEVLDLHAPQDDRRLTLEQSMQLVQERYAEALTALGRL